MIFSKTPKITLIFALLHALVVIFPAYFINIWADEASTLHSTQNGFFFALQNAFSIERQAPLYFWFLSLWRDISDSIFFARLFSIICSFLAILVFFRLARKISDEKFAVFMTAFFAFHPYLIWASLEIRLYSLVILLTVLILDLFFDIFFEREKIEHLRCKEILFVVISAVALYTNYYLGFLLVGCFFALLILRKWREGKKYFFLMFAVGLFFLPLFLAMKSQLANNASGYQVEKNFAEGLRLFWNYFLSFVLPTEIFPSSVAQSSTISFVRLWIVRLAISAAIVLLIKKRKLFDEKIIAFGTICAVIVAFLLVAYFALGPIYVAIRHAAILFVPVLFFVFTAGKAISPEMRSEKKSSVKNIVPIFLGILIAPFFLYSIFSLYPNFSKRGDWAKVASYIEANEKPSQPIIIFPNYDALSLPVYYKGANKILPDEKFVTWDFEAEPGSELSAKRQTDFVISEIPPEAGEIWLLTDESCEVSEQCRPLENFVEANYTVIETKYFYLEKLRLLRKK